MIENAKSPFQTEEQKRIHREFWKLNREKLDCETKMLNLRREMCDTFPFKVGDYVIFDSWRKRQGWIARMIMDKFFSYVIIHFNPPKKDGTPSRKEEMVMINLLRELDKVIISNPPQHEQD